MRTSQKQSNITFSRFYEVKKKMKLHQSNFFLRVQNLRRYPFVWCSPNLEEKFKKSSHAKMIIFENFIYSSLTFGGMGKSPKTKKSAKLRIYCLYYMINIITSSIRRLFFFRRLDFFEQFLHFFLFVFFFFSFISFDN